MLEALALEGLDARVKILDLHWYQLRGFIMSEPKIGNVRNIIDTLFGVSRIEYLKISKSDTIFVIYICIT